MSSLSQIQKEMKENILADYLSGMSLTDIASKYGFSHERTVYYHIQPLTTEKKVLHLQNAAKLKEENEKNLTNTLE